MENSTTKTTLEPILLHPHHKISMVIHKITEYRNRTEPTSLEQNRKVSKMELLTDAKNTYYGDSIILNGELLCYESHFISLIEILNCFTSKLLDTELTYKIEYAKLKAGYSAKIRSKKSEHYLHLVAKEGSEVYLTKYDCKVIVNKFNKLYAKCFPLELA